MSTPWGMWKNAAVATALAAATVLSLILTINERNGVRCQTIDVRVSDSGQIRFVTKDMVRLMLDSSGVQIKGIALNDLNLHQIKELFTHSPYIKNSQINSTMRGDVRIRIEQHKPQVRVMTESGYDFYADSLGNIIPPSDGYNYDVPLVNGQAVFPFAPNFYGNFFSENNVLGEQYLKNLINFVMFIDQDKFLSSFVSQIYLLPSREAELICVVKDQVVEFGSLDNWHDKIVKTKDFLAQAPPEVSAGNPCRIVVKYKDQIILKASTPEKLVQTK